MNNTFILSALAVGFLGSFHCVGMCGPIAVSLPKGDGSKKEIAGGRILYNIGRIVTYSIMGLIAGLAGYSFSIKGFQSELSIFSGILIVLIVILSYVNKFSIRFSKIISSLTFNLKKQFKKLFTKGSPWFLFSIGLLNGLLPCGFVYLSLAGALATGNYIDGMLYMAMFGLGTLPAMLTISLAGHLIGFRFQKFIKKASPIIAIALAVLLIQRGSIESSQCCNHQNKECSAK